MRFLDRLLFRASRRAAALQLAIADFGLAALDCHDVADLARESREIVFRVTDCDEAGVFGYDALRRAFVPLAGVTWLPAGAVVPDDDDLAVVVRKNGAAFVHDDATQERRADMTRLVRAGFRSGIVALVGPREKPLGIIAAHARSPHRFVARDAALVRLVANITAAAAVRLAVEADLRTARGLYESVIRSAQAGIVTLDVNGILTFVNPNAAGMGGCPEQLLGRDSMDLVIEEDRPLLLALREATLRGEASKADLRLRGANGIVTWASVTTNPLTDADGRGIGMMAVIGDITDRVIAAETLRLQKGQLDDAQAIAHVGSWEVDLDERTVVLSEEMFRILGVEPDASPVFPQSLAPLIPPGTPNEPDALLEKMASSPEFDLVYEVVRRDGARRWVRSRGRTEFNALTGKRRIFGTTQDITAEKLTGQAREEMAIRLRNAANEWKETVDSIPSPVLIVDEDLRVVRMNAAALKLTWFDSYAAALMARIDEMGEAAVWKELARVAEICLREHSYTGRIDDADGKQWDVFASRWNVGPDVRATLFIADVTEIVRLETSLRRDERMSAVGALVAGVAHEVRNPLFGISAALDALEATGNGTLLDRVMSSLRQQVTRLNELMRDLLEYGKPAPPVFKSEAVSQLLAEAVESTSALAEYAGVALAVDAAEGMPRISMDPRRMLQVVENLIKNAVQHSPRGGLIDVRASAGPAAIYITVEDRGPGFTAAELPRIFEPFFTKRRGGTGLGLSLAQRIVDDHGGSLTAGNRDGGGASMTVTLPFERGESQ